MIFTPELLSALEKNADLKKDYAAEGSLGQNRLVALPVIIGFIAAFCAYFFYDLSKTDSTYTTYLIISAVIILVCIVAVVILQMNAKKKVLENLDGVKTCIGKKIYGNDDTQVYYGIYTLGSKRHDPEFIEDVAYKIFNINMEPNDKMRSEINDMFSAKLEGMNATPVLLPTAFTNGEEVFKKEFKFLAIENDMKEHIAANEDKFIALSFNNRSVVPLKRLN
jgi:hypothetical protein